MTAEAQRLCDLLGIVGQRGRLLDAIRRGLSARLIAAELGITEGTVKSRTNHLYAFLGVKNRVEAAILAERALIEDRLMLAEQHAQAQRSAVVVQLLGELLTYLAQPKRTARAEGTSP
jgi:DNA-binding CsgD family transcriptional regulator